MKVLTVLFLSSALFALSCDTKVDPDKDIHADSKHEKNEADKIDGVNSYGNDVDGRNSIKRDSNGVVKSNTDDDVK